MAPPAAHEKGCIRDEQHTDKLEYHESNDDEDDDDDDDDEDDDDDHDDDDDDEDDGEHDYRTSVGST